MGNNFSASVIDERLAAAVESGAVVGLSLALVQDGQVTFARGYGRTASDEAGVGVEAGTRFAFGSIAKVICATMIMRLVEQGALQLDRPLLDYLPRLSFSDEAYGRRLTLRHVLSHTTGLPAAGREFGPQGAAALQALIEAEIPAYQFVAPPGALHLYANTAYCLAGYAAEVVTGQRYDALVQELVFDALAMAQATFDMTAVAREQPAFAHEGEGAERRVIRRLPENDAGHPSSFAYGTATDLAHLAVLQLEGGLFRGRELLSGPGLREMQRRHASRYVTGASHPLAYLSRAYGLGIMVGDYQGRPVLRHGGMAQSYNCFFELLPQARCGFVLMTNASEEGALMALLASLYDLLLGLAPGGGRQVTVPEYTGRDEEQRWAAYEGDYLNVEWGGLLKIRVEAGRLVVSDGEVERALTCSAPGRYYVTLESGARLPLAFIGDGAAPVAHLTYAGATYHRYTFHAPAQPDAGWSSFEGVYCDPYNRDEEDTIRLVVEEGRLWIQQGRGGQMPCEALGARAFRCDWGFFELETDAESAAPFIRWGKATCYLRAEEASQAQEEA